MKKDDVTFYLIASGIGALTGFGLSFTALSPLVIGGIVGSIAPALITFLLAEVMLYQSCKRGYITEEAKGLFGFLQY